jgi:hypothetical protein
VQQKSFCGGKKRYGNQHPGWIAKGNRLTTKPESDTAHTVPINIRA